MRHPSAALRLLVCTSIVSLACCQQRTSRNPYDSTKFDVVCSKELGCISDCRASYGFCLDERVHRKRSASYILNDRVLFLRAHIVRVTNESVVSLIHESFEMPLSVFSAETFAGPAATRRFTKFSQLKQVDNTLSSLRGGDPYCVWPRSIGDPEFDVGDCVVTEEQDTLSAATLFQTTGSFGHHCGVRRFRRS